MGTAIKHPVPDRVKPVICNFWHPDTLTLSPERQSARMSKITSDRLNRPVQHRMLYSCTRTAVVGVKGIKAVVNRVLCVVCSVTVSESGWWTHRRWWRSFCFKVHEFWGSQHIMSLLPCSPSTVCSRLSEKNILYKVHLTGWLIDWAWYNVYTNTV